MVNEVEERVIGERERSLRNPDGREDVLQIHRLTHQSPLLLALKASSGTSIKRYTFTN